MHEVELRSRALDAFAGAGIAVLQHTRPQNHACKGDDTKIAAAKRTNRGVGGAPRVVIVEDDALICADIECMLEELGYEVLGVAHQLGAALDFLSKHAAMIDCVILDIQLAGQTCLPVARALDDLRVPYLFITGHNTETVRKLGLVGDVIEKPFLGRQLEAHLSALVASR